MKGFILRYAEGCQNISPQNENKQIHAQPVQPDLGRISGRMTLVINWTRVFAET